LATVESHTRLSQVWLEASTMAATPKGAMKALSR
jgi:hypothetical protein